MARVDPKIVKIANLMGRVEEALYFSERLLAIVDQCKKDNLTDSTELLSSVTKEVTRRADKLAGELLAELEKASGLKATIDKLLS